MNSRLRQERNAFALLIVVAIPLVLLVAPLPYLTALSNQKAAAAGGTQQKAGAKPAKKPGKPSGQARS